MVSTFPQIVFSTYIGFYISYFSTIAFRTFNGFHGEGDGPVFGVTCTGTENRLDECMVSNQTTCSHSQDGGADCAGMLVDQQLQAYICLYQ